MSARRRYALAFLFGIAATFTLAPFFLAPLAVVAYGGLYWLLQSAETPRRAFAIGWWWGWGFYITGLYWFCIALLTDPDKFAWLIPFALFGLTAVIAIYSGVASAIYHRIRPGGIADIFIFSVVWTLVEYARGHLFTGFPWNLPGYALAFSDASLQLASLFGIYGLSWITVFLGALPAAWILKYRRAKLYCGAAYALFALGCLWGALRLEGAPAGEVEGVKLRLVQANISQPHKWDPKRQFDGLMEHIKLTQSPGLSGITHVIWPETAVPYVVQPHSRLTEILSQALPKTAFLIAGDVRGEEEGDDFRLYNSIFVLNAQGEIISSYDKHKLVPFGEFLPFRSLLPKAWLTPVGDKDFSAGPGPQTLDWPGLPPVSPLVCYEAIFPAMAAGGQDRPQLLLNLTNDAWFGLSTGPHQHFEMARMRAVEQGVPLVRVANTGISAVTDGYGRIRALLQLGQKGVLDAALPLTISSPTLYTQFDDYLLRIVTLWALLLIVWKQKTRKN